MKARTIAVGLAGSMLAIAFAQLITAAVWTHISVGGSEWGLLWLLAPLALGALTTVAMVLLDRADQDAKERREASAWADVQTVFTPLGTPPLAMSGRPAGIHRGRRRAR